MSHTNIYDQNQIWVEQNVTIIPFTPSSSMGGITPTTNMSSTTLFISDIGTSYLLPSTSTLPGHTLENQSSN